MATKENLPATQDTNTLPSGLPDLAGLSDLKQFKAKQGEQVIGLEAMDITDLKLPKYRLLQSNSIEVTKGGHKAGQFYNSITKEAVDELHVTLLSLGKSRVMWPAKFKRGDDPLCRSFDNVLKYDGTMQCAKCPYSNWDKAKAEGKNKPDCNMSYAWLAVNEDTKLDFRITMGGMSVGPTKDFLNLIAPQRLSTFAYKVTLSSKQEENENGVFHTVQYKITGAVTADEYRELEERAIGLKELFSTAIKNDTLSSDDMVVEEGTSTPNGVLF